MVSISERRYGEDQATKPPASLTRGGKAFLQKLWKAQGYPERYDAEADLVEAAPFYADNARSVAQVVSHLLDGGYLDMIDIAYDDDDLAAATHGQLIIHEIALSEQAFTVLDRRARRGYAQTAYDVTLPDGTELSRLVNDPQPANPTGYATQDKGEWYLAEICEADDARYAAFGGYYSQCPARLAKEQRFPARR